MRRTAVAAALLPHALLLALRAPPAVPSPVPPPVVLAGHDTTSCAAGARCSAVGRVVEGTGTAHAHARFRREARGRVPESSFAHAGQRVSFEVPPGTTRAVARFVWLVSSAAGSARAAAGRVQAASGLAAWAPWCAARCKATDARVELVGLEARPGDGRTAVDSEALRRVSLVVEVRGRLPTAVSWQVYAFAVAAGEPAPCRPRGCAEDHAGEAWAAVTATLVSAELLRP